MKKRLLMVAATGALVAALVPGASAFAQDGPWTVVAEGLDAPRGMDFGPDGLLYVATAGAGGDQCFDAPSPEGGEMVSICVGPSGSISAVDTASGSVTQVVSGLASLSSPEGALGPSSVAVSDMGDIYYTTGDANEVDVERTEGDTGGIAWKVAADGTSQVVADLIAAEAASNPDGGILDSNPNGIAVAPDGNLLVADAGANALLMIDADGNVSTVAVFPDTMMEMPPMPGEGEAGGEPEMGPVQAVPTSVTIGNDGAAYVTFLTGFPFAPGAAWVARVAQGEEPTVYADGFTMAMGSAMASDGTLYVVEIFTNGMLSGDPTGGLWSVPPGGGEPTLITTEGLVTPGGIAIDANDNVYVANGGGMPGMGTIVKLNQ